MLVACRNATSSASGRSSPSRLLAIIADCVGSMRIIDFEIDARAARLDRRGDPAPRFAGNERAASDFADHEAAAQQLGVDPARGRDRDLALIGETALRRQPIAGFERAIGDLGGDGIGKLQIFELGHYCTESNVLLAPRNVPDHFEPIKPEIALRRVQAIRTQCVQPLSQRLRRRHRFAVRKPTGEEHDDDHDFLDRRPACDSRNLPGGLFRRARQPGATRSSTYLERRAAIKTLRELDDRALRDIGIERSQIEAAVHGVVDPEFGRHQVKRPVTPSRHGRSIAQCRLRTAIRCRAAVLSARRTSLSAAPPAPSIWRSAPHGRHWSRGNRSASPAGARSSRSGRP